MEIKRLSELEIKVILNEKDMQIMNISFADFEENNPRSEEFLSELMFILRETWLIKISEGNIEVDVALTGAGTINIYFRLPKIDSHHTTELAIIAADPDKLISKAAEIHKAYADKITKSSLYQLPSGHALIFTIGYAHSTVAKKALLKACIADNVLINKIKEYSPMVSNTPFDKLNYFS
ncbi:adaptor protein MecA [Ruminococcus sp.]